MKNMDGLCSGKLVRSLEKIIVAGSRKRLQILNKKSNDLYPFDLHLFRFAQLSKRNFAILVLASRNDKFENFDSNPRKFCFCVSENVITKNGSKFLTHDSKIDARDVWKNMDLKITIT